MHVTIQVGMLVSFAGVVKRGCPALQALQVDVHPCKILPAPVVGRVGLAGLVARLAEAGLPEEHNPILLGLQDNTLVQVIVGHDMAMDHWIGSTELGADIHAGVPRPSQRL